MKLYANFNRWMDRRQANLSQFTLLFLIVVFMITALINSALIVWVGFPHFLLTAIVAIFFVVVRGSWLRKTSTKH